MSDGTVDADAAAAAAAASQCGLRAGLALFRRLPPAAGARTLAALSALAPACAADFYARCDVPPAVARDGAGAGGKAYLLCDYNRDGDAWRSPWTGAYAPALPPGEAGFAPGPALRALEVAANEACEAYCAAYYGAAAVSSVYAWELAAPGAFACVWLVAQVAAAGGGGEGGGEGGGGGGGGAGASSEPASSSSSWHAFHVCEVAPAARGGAAPHASSFRYSLTSTVLLSVSGSTGGGSGTRELSGSLTRQATAEGTAADALAHVACIGGMVERIEADMRAAVAELYIAKSREVAAALHARGGGAGTTAADAAAHASALAAAVRTRSAEAGSR